MIRKRRQLRSPNRYRSARSTARVPRGYPIGHKDGYQEGLRMGYDSFRTLFEGTSIIIPSYNQVDYLKKCIESIREHTDLSYEIIVVDNASKDGTAEYLRGIGSLVRYRILETNRGFAGAINVGMMMAKGKTMVLLNNDTIVTERWLGNMLQCLNSDPKIGMVGPVTNYISGDQLIEVPYTSVEDMPVFARGFNVPDPGKWQRTDRLTGFCLLFRRELWERTGFLDEGYALGNYEDDDYNIRVRLQGYSLVIARDTFIHHYGSISMKALGERLVEVNDHNMHFYADKWGNPYDLLQRVREMMRLRASEEETEGKLLPMGETAFFPQGIVARGVGDTLFWVEGGMRRPVLGELSLPVVRLSQVDLQRWTIGEAISAEEAEERWHGRVLSGNQPAVTSGTAIGPDGFFYVVEDGVRRRVVSRTALETWGLQLKPHSTISVDQLGMLPEGLPIIPPVRVAAHL